MLAEAFGFPNEQKRYIYLSDGGHFENLGPYEMVLRRYRYILVSDAGCDEKMEFRECLAVSCDEPVSAKPGLRARYLSPIPCDRPHQTPSFIPRV